MICATPFGAENHFMFKHKRFPLKTSLSTPNSCSSISNNQRTRYFPIIYTCVIIHFSYSFSVALAYVPLLTQTELSSIGFRTAQHALLHALHQVQISKPMNAIIVAISVVDYHCCSRLFKKEIIQGNFLCM